MVFFFVVRLMSFGNSVAQRRSYISLFSMVRNIRFLRLDGHLVMRKQFRVL